MANLYELLEKKAPIFVTNHSAGMIILEFRQEGSTKRSFAARVPPVVDHPMRLDTVVPYAILKYDHSVLHNWIQKGALVLHDPEEVKNHYSDEPELQEAVQEVLGKANKEKKFQAKDIGLKVADGSMEEAKRKAGKDDGVDVRVSGRRAGTSDYGTDADAVVISPKILQVVANLKEDPNLHQEALTKLRTLDKKSLTEPALWYVMTECKDFPAITKWAKHALAKEHGPSES